ncbi:MAG: B12-binding domain-containing radical SAM protein [Kiritimatiellae bacterium]|nr:B12-binding domain-containing radical SAM protein [Kiritimatiellia bacterium]
MQIILIAPASGKWRHVGRRRLFSGKTFRFSMLSLLSVAAETPPGVDVRIVDEQIEEVPWDADVDLVGITCMTALAPRAYEIAARFRARGIRVVLGGMHPTLFSEEALRHADAVVAGEAEGQWPRVIEDARAGRLKGIYRSETLHDLRGLKPVPRHLLRGKQYATVHAVQATRGCPHGCDFCAVSAFNRQTQRRRPVDEVVAEVQTIPDRFFIFVDDNLTADPEYAKALFTALAPLRKWWITQATLAIADDEALLDLAARAGCKGVFVGLETFSEVNLEGVNKGFNKVDDYRQKIARLHAHGIAVEAGIVFGFDGDRPEVFARTLKMLDDLEIDVIQVSIFTPLPGTRRFEAMQARLTDRDWAHYDFHSVVFQPAGMDAASLQAGHDWVTREFYRPWRILRRLWRHALRPGGVGPLVYLAAINFAYYGRVVRWGIRGCNPAAKRAAWPSVLGEQLAPARASL